MPKKILIFSLSFFPHVGGAEIAIKEITDRIPAQDIEFSMITMRMSRFDAPYEQVGNISVYRISSLGTGRFGKFLFQFLAPLFARRLHKKHQFDVVWAMMAHSAGVPAVLFNYLYPKVPYILTLQEGDPLEHVERVMRPLWPLFIRAFRRADVVQPISEFLGAWARRRGFAGKLEVIPNGVDTKKFIGASLSHEGIILVTTSRLVHKNGLSAVVRALPLLPQQVQFHLVGQGPDEDTLRSLAKELRVESRVKFLGYVEYSRIPAYLHTADIFIRPSRSEGMGNSFIEAFAAGIPVIATPVGGIPDFLFDSKQTPGVPATGFMVDPDSPEQIAQKVLYILDNPKEVREVIENARQVAMTKYDWDLVAHAMRERVFGRFF